MSTIEQYLPMVSKIASQRAKRSNKDYDDLYQEGCLALISAFDRLDARPNNKEITFLHHRVYWAIFDYAYPNRRRQDRPAEICTSGYDHGTDHDGFSQVDDEDEVVFLEGRLTSSQKEVVRLRSSGLKFHEIGEKLGYSKQRAQNIYQESVGVLRNA